LSVATGQVGTDVGYKIVGNCDMYCRNGKASKGTFATKKDQMKGIIIADTVAAVIGMDFDKSPSIYIKKVVTPGTVGITNNCGLTFDKYFALTPNKGLPFK
jgi:hypothetical protein